MSRADAWHAAVAWVRQHGGAVRGLGFDGGDFDGGVKAQSSLDVGTPILSVPMSLWITADVARRASSVGKAAADAVEAAEIAGEKLNGTSADIILAFHLAYDSARPESPFSPYYRTLPTGADDPRIMLPRCWSGGEIDALLRGSPAADAARHSRRAVALDYDIVTAKARAALGSSAGAWPGFEAYDWASAMVSSRSFCLTTASGEVDALVPLLDMLNHARPRETSYHVSEGGGSPGSGAALEVCTLRPVAEGRAIHNTYGAKGNAQLLGSYGFTTLVNFEPDGSANDVRELPLPQAAPGTPAPLVHVPCTHAPLRIGPKRYAYTALSKALDAFRAASVAADGGDKLAGVALEVRALRALRDAIDSEVAAYSMSEDDAIAAVGLQPPKPPEAVSESGGFRSDVWSRRAAAAAAVVLNELLTLGWYRAIVSRCLAVLSPARHDGSSTAGSSSGATTKLERRKASAQRLKAEVEGELARASATSATGNGRDVAALRWHASSAHAAEVALVYLQIRFSSLLQSMEEPSSTSGSGSARAAGQSTQQQSRSSHATGKAKKRKRD
jgi:hypothetical protein